MNPIRFTKVLKNKVRWFFYSKSIWFNTKIESVGVDLNYLLKFKSIEIIKCEKSSKIQKSTLNLNSKNKFSELKLLGSDVFESEKYQYYIKNTKYYRGLLYKETPKFFVIRDVINDVDYLNRGRPSILSVKNFLRIKFVRSKIINSGISYILFEGKSTNYYHLIVDNLCKLMQLDVDELDQIDNFIIPDRELYLKTRYFWDLLNIPEHKIIYSRKSIKLTKVLCVNPVRNIHVTNSFGILNFRKLVFDKIDHNKKDSSRVLYFTRGEHVKRRRLLNEDELLKNIQIDIQDIEIVDPGALSYIDQIVLILGVKVLIAPHGGALTNIIFGRRLEKVVELVPEDSGDYFHFLSLSRSLGIKHAIVVGERIDQLDNFTISPNEVLNALNA